MEKTVISLGGSTLFTEGGKVDKKFVNEFCAIVLDAAKKWETVIVVGGGKPAGIAAEKARKKTGSEFFADRAAIAVTWKNAELVRTALGKSAGAKVAKSFDEAASYAAKGKISVGGGLLEGITTDTVSVLTAERIGAAKVVNVSNVDGIYSADPKKDKNATRFDQLSHGELVALASKNDQRMARTNFVFDAIAAKIAARSKIEVDFVAKENRAGIAAAIEGKEFRGTKVRG